MTSETKTQEVYEVHYRDIGHGKRTRWFRPTDSEAPEIEEGAVLFYAGTVAETINGERLPLVGAIIPLSMIEEINIVEEEL